MSNMALNTPRTSRNKNETPKDIKDFTHGVS